MKFTHKQLLAIGGCRTPDPQVMGHCAFHGNVRQVSHFCHSARAVDGLFVWLVRSECRFTQSQHAELSSIRLAGISKTAGQAPVRRRPTHRQLIALAACRCPNPNILFFGRRIFVSYLALPANSDSLVAKILRADTDSTSSVNSAALAGMRGAGIIKTIV